MLNYTFDHLSIVAQNRPVLHRRAVFFCADDRYIPYSLFLAAQIAAQYPERDFDICIISESNVSDHPLFADLNIRYLQVDISQIQKFANVGQRIGMAAYLRIFMPRIWQNDYDRLLYLDGDIFYQRGDIPALLSSDIHNAPLAAVLDTKQWHRPLRPASDITALRLPFSPYFNSGVLLIDVAKFNALSIGEKVLDLISQRGADLVWHDQTALNAVLGGNWAQLPVQWNFQYSHKTMLLSAHFDVCFYHFIGRRKPFYARYGGFPRRFTDAYRAFLAQHFPPLAAQVQNGTGGPKRLPALLMIFLFNWTMARGVLRMEQACGGDFDISPPRPHH
jgi:hypothetical protein